MNQDIIAIQQYYPRIYMACHVEHKREKTTGENISMRDNAILAHLSSQHFTYPSRLARHLNINKATLSEALATLIEHGYVLSQTDADDQRRQQLSLSEKGLEVMSRSSVLDSDKICALLSKLGEQEKIQAIHGLSLLAKAAMSLVD